MKKLNTIHLVIDIQNPKEDVWNKLVNEFGQVNDWNPLIQASRSIGSANGAVGDERQCEISPGNYVQEKISQAKGKDEVKIDIVEGGIPMLSDANAIFKLTKLSDSSTRVHLQMNVQTKPKFMFPVMKSKMKAQFFTLLIGLKYHMETSALVTKGNIKQIKDEYSALKASESFEVLSEPASV